MLIKNLGATLNKYMIEFEGRLKWSIKKQVVTRSCLQGQISQGIGSFHKFHTSIPFSIYLIVIVK